MREMNTGASVTYAVLGLWVSIGILAYIVMRDRRRRKKRQAEIEQKLALWVDAERRRGKSVTAIAEELPKRRKELEQNP